MIWVAIGIACIGMIVFAMALCKAAGDADRRMEEMYRQEGWGKE